MLMTVHTSNYTIKPGDNIHTIAKEFNTTPYEIIKINGNVPLIIQPYRQIKVPASTNLYVTQNGETVNDLLIRFKLTPEELFSMNQELYLLSGQAVRIKR